MRTSEFIERALKFKDISEYERENGIIRFYNTQASLVAMVSENDTNYSSFAYVKKYSKLELLALLYEYAKTPLEEREEPKRYKLQHKLVEDAYLNYVKDRRKKLTFSKGIECLEYVRTIFTIQEWEMLTGQKWEDLLLQFKAIEV